MITEIEIRDCYGIPDLKAKLGQIVMIQGANGTGKTSLLNALMKIFEGGHDPGMVRQVAERAVASFTLDTGHKFRYECSSTSYTLTGWNADGTVIRGPKTFLEKHIAGIEQVDPSRLLALDASTKPGRAKLRDELQRLIPLSFLPEDVQSVATLYEGALSPAEVEPVRLAEKLLLGAVAAHGKPADLATYDGVVASLKQSRARVGAEEKQAASAWQGLTTAVGDLIQSPETELAAARAEMADYNSARSADAARLDAETVRLNTAAWTACREAKAAAEAAFREAIAQATAAAEAECVRIAAVAQRVLAEAQPAHEERIAASAARISALEAAQKQWIEAQQTVKLREDLRDTAKAKASEWLKVDRACKLMELLRIKKMADFPIAGLEVTADRITVDGVDWHALNTAQVMQICIRIVARLAGNEKIIFLDHAETFDADTMEAVAGACRDAGFQLLAARVADGPLAILAGQARRAEGAA